MAAAKRKLSQSALNAQETKNKLFWTALMMFAQHGYNTVTVEEITREAGFSKGTFYAYFPSKESVFLEHFRMIDTHYEQVFQAVEERASASERVLILISAMCDYCANIVGMVPLQIIYANQITSPDAVRILNNNDRVVYRILEDCVERGKVSGEFPKGEDSKEMVELLMRSARGLIYDWCMYKNTFDLEKEGGRYFSKILHLMGLAAEEERKAAET